MISVKKVLFCDGNNVFFIILHPFLFAVFPVVFLLSQNISESTVIDIIFPLLVILSITSIFFYLFRVIFRSLEKASIATSFFLLLFFSYGHVFEPQMGMLWLRHRYLLSLWSLLFGGSIYLLFRTKKDLLRLNSFLSIVAFILVASSVGSISMSMYRTSGYSNINPLDSMQQINEWQGVGQNIDREKMPDIYYIILDAYGSNEVLSEHGYDNLDFTQYLLQKGFYVVPRSWSNYNFTNLTLSSTLNMDYIENLSSPRGVISAETIDHRTLIESSAVQRLLKDQGYRFIHFGGFVNATYRNRNADEDYNVMDLSEFSRILYNTTMLFPVGQKVNLFSERKVQYRRILNHFEILSQLPQRREGKPLFVFAHLITPHAPYVFDRDGEFIQNEPTADLKDAYIDQLTYLNGQLEILVDNILEYSSRKPIIILQGDHGPRLNDTRIADPKDLTDWYIRDRFGNLNAYYFPDNEEQVLYDTITPVNTFRVIFNNYFGTEYELLQDRSYLAPPWSRWYKCCELWQVSSYPAPAWGNGYDFVDVTERLRAGGDN